MSPTTAFHILQGIETLPLRMEKHVRNAREIAEFLGGSDAVEWVVYPELDDHPDKALASELLPKGAGSMIAFGIKGGREAGKTFIERLQVWSHLANVGDAKSLVIHPASTTHQQMDADTMKKAGLSEDLVRLSVGLKILMTLKLIQTSFTCRNNSQGGLIMETQLNGKSVFFSTGETKFNNAEQTIIFIHGAGMDRTVWSMQARFLLIVASRSEPGCLLQKVGKACV